MEGAKAEGGSLGGSLFSDYSNMYIYIYICIYTHMWLPDTEASAKMEKRKDLRIIAICLESRMFDCQIRHAIPPPPPPLALRGVGSQGTYSAPFWILIHLVFGCWVSQECDPNSKNVCTATQALDTLSVVSSKCSNLSTVGGRSIASCLHCCCSLLDL